MSMRTPLGKVRGLGSAREGTGHFIAQRATAVALIPLTLFLVFLAIRVSGTSYEQARGVLASPLVAILLLAAILAGVYHMRIGMQVIIEDYVPNEALRVIVLLLNTFFAGFIAIACVWAVAKLSFGI